MTEDKDWFPWTRHDGSGCPCVGKRVQILCDRAIAQFPTDAVLFAKNGLEYTPKAGENRSWCGDPDFVQVVQYRIRKPDALLDMIRMVEEIDPPKLRDLETI